MSGHAHWQGRTPAEPGLSGFSSTPRRTPRRPGARSRRGLMVFAIALTVALGGVLMMIATSSVQAMSQAAFADPKSDSWVGMAAIGSVLVCALLGMVIVHRYTSTRHR